MYRVIRRFKDRDTNKILEVGDKIEELSAEREEVLLGKNEYNDVFIEKVEEPKVKKETEEEKPEKPATKKTSQKKSAAKKG